MSVRVAINGFGRIGRIFYRAAMNNPEVDVVAANDITDAETNAHLLKYDSIHGTLKEKVEVRDGSIFVDGKKLAVLSMKDPAALPWADLGVEIVVESTGLFTDADKAAAHLRAGAKRVVITAPAKNEDATLVMGVNEHTYDPSRHRIVSNASCTTNCLAVVAKVVHESFTIRRGLMTTVHAYTNDQRILDLTHKDLRRARAAAMSIVPTTTGAAKAVGLVLPELKGKLNGFAMRCPVPNVSVVDLVAELSRPVTVEEVNGALRTAAEGRLKQFLAFTDLPLVSVDFNGDAHSAIVDGLSTMVVDQAMAKVVAWYDNEWGYSNRVVDLVAYMARCK